jgi:hypothetical protein
MVFVELFAATYIALGKSIGTVVGHGYNQPNLNRHTANYKSGLEHKICLLDNFGTVLYCTTDLFTKFNSLWSVYVNCPPAGGIYYFTQK